MDFVPSMMAKGYVCFSNLNKVVLCTSVLKLLCMFGVVIVHLN